MPTGGPTPEMNDFDIGCNMVIENGIDVTPITVREAQTSPWNFVSSNTRRCFDPVWRKMHHEVNSSGPRGRIYLLWGCFQAFGEPMKEAVETASILGAYQSPALAEHDGLCWLLGKQEDMGFSDEGYSEIELHGRRYEGCFLYRTPHTLAYKIEGMVWTWTETKLLS
jgi:hypothetical protein